MAAALGSAVQAGATHPDVTAGLNGMNKTREYRLYSHSQIITDV